MEVRANYTIIGLFTLLALLGIVFFTLWLAKLDQGVEMCEYEISLGEKVSGLALNSDVLFCGVRVGAVTKITINENVPGAVKVRIAISADTPVRQDSMATLESKGVTGVMLISISGGTPGSPLSRPPEGEVGTIDYEVSPFAAVLSNVPSTLEATNRILDRINNILSEDNQKSIQVTLKSIETLSTTLANRAESLDNAISSAEKSMKNIENITNTVNKILAKDGASAIKNASAAAARLESTLAVMEPGLKQFSKEGLGEVRMLLIEARNLVHVLTRVGQKVESDPRRFLFGEPTQEYTPQ